MRNLAVKASIATSGGGVIAIVFGVANAFAVIKRGAPIKPF